MAEAYSIGVGYSTVFPDRKDVSLEVFKMMIDRGLEFSAGVGPAPAGHDLQAIRVSIYKGNLNTCYSPITEMERFEKALDDLVAEECVPRGR